jgi:hypothetical protein
LVRCGVVLLLLLLLLWQCTAAMQQQRQQRRQSAACWRRCYRTAAGANRDAARRHGTITPQHREFGAAGVKERPHQRVEHTPNRCARRISICMRAGFYVKTMESGLYVEMCL